MRFLSFFLHAFALSLVSASQYVIGSGYSLSRSGNTVSIELGNQQIWSTSTPFLSASAGNDSVIGVNGNFNITQVDETECTGQSINSIKNVPWGGAKTGTGVQLAGELSGCGTAHVPYELTFWIDEDLTDRVRFYVNIQSQGSPANPLKKLFLRYDSNANEDFYGFGAQASFASLKNKSVPIFSREQGVGRGDEPITYIANTFSSFFTGGNQYTTYTAIPSYITTEGNVFYLSEKSAGYTNFDLTKPDLVTVRYDSLSVDGAFFRADNMFDAVERLTAFTGRMPALPTWVDNGAILGIQGGETKVKSIVAESLSYDCPVAAVWLQDWAGVHNQTAPYVNISRLWWNWEADLKLYPAWNEFVQSLRDEHQVRTLSYVNPFLANVSTDPDGFRRNLYAEAVALPDYLVQNATTKSTAIVSSGPGLDAGIIDLTNPALVNWFDEVMTDQVWNANISGFMSDFGEYTPVTSDTSLKHLVSDAFFFHNQYPFLWAQFQRRLAEKLKVQNDSIIFHRSAAMGANKYMNLFWAGDQNVNWGLNDGIKSVVTIFMHMGLSGYAHLHSDIGGYTTVLTPLNYNITRSAELLGRWGELAALSSSVFRSHEGSVPSVNAQFYTNSSTYKYYAYNARVFASLGPYRRNILDTECATKGWPLMRPPVMYHPQDMMARNISYQSFYLGSGLYIAPVLDQGNLTVQVYLPGESWTYTHVWTGVEYLGGRSIDVAAPYGKPAVFTVNGTGCSELKPFMSFVRKENATTLSIE